MSCPKISRHRQLNAWRMELTTVQETFSCKTIFFKIDQLIAMAVNRDHFRLVLKMQDLFSFL